MKFQFDTHLPHLPHLPHQSTAIQSVLGVFAGRSLLSKLPWAG